ncbi:4'-phosphopantetheinyl transferase family protein [Streptomyces sp. NPDC101225]|uniref:4'-phosphopantetheinyl transferase family protein n=1 Tax=Streptomyces sp. NPDC101225 TaxID=3366135 RepID=UPI00381B38A7
MSPVFPHAPSSPARVWWWRLPLTYTPADLALLSPAERDRVDRTRSTRAKASLVVTRARARRVLGELLGVPPRRIRLGRAPCPCCDAPDQGPPVVLHPGGAPRISLSHTTGCAALAVCEGPVGVDVEERRPLPVSTLAASTLTPGEAEHLADMPAGPGRDAAFLRCWTRKEAVLKAVGTGITSDLTVLETLPGSSGPVRVEAGAHPAAPRPWSVTDLPLPAPWTASLATPHGTPGPPLVTRYGDSVLTPDGGTAPLTPPSAARPGAT